MHEAAHEGTDGDAVPLEGRRPSAVRAVLVGLYGLAHDLDERFGLCGGRTAVEYKRPGVFQRVPLGFVDGIRNAGFG